MFVPRKERGDRLWTVGWFVYDHERQPVWHAMRDFPTEQEAWRFIHYLNGGTDRVLFNS